MDKFRVSRHFVLIEFNWFAHIYIFHVSFFLVFLFLFFTIIIITIIIIIIIIFFFETDTNAFSIHTAMNQKAYLHHWILDYSIAKSTHYKLPN